MEQTKTTHEEALAELAGYPQWVAWEYRENGKRKAPINPHTWRDASSTDSSTWGSYEEALLCAGSTGQIGFVFSEHDPFTGIDLDDCVLDGEVLPWAVEIVEALDSYTEVSPSGTGLKVWVRASKPGTKCRTGGIEVYDSGRFFTVTGKQFDSQWKIAARQNELERLYHELFPQEECTQEDLHGGVESAEGFGGDDVSLLEKARNASGTGKLFARLYDLGDKSMYSFDDSRADIALCGMLAYWTACDEERMDRLFRASKLMRKKWDSRRSSSTYGEWTIARAIKGCKNVYDPDSYKAKVNEDIHVMLMACMELAVSGKWSGRSGPTDRDVYRALIDTAVEYGRKVDDGVKVSASLRDLALKSGVGRRGTISASLQRLEARELIRKGHNGGTRKASEYVLLTRNRTINNRVNKYGTPLSQTVLIRNPGITYGTIGKKSAQLIDYVHSLGRAVTADELARHFGMRKNNLMARNIKTLLGLGLLGKSGNGYVTPADIEQRLERELKESGCREAHELQRQQYERERRAWRERKAAPSTPNVLGTSNEPQEAIKTMTKNIPTKSEDGIIHHGPECACWMCDEEAPEYLETRQEIAA